MSLAGAIRTRGSTVSLYSPTYPEATDKSKSITWTLVASVQMLLDTLTTERAQQLFGEVETIDVQGLVMIAQAVQKDWGVVVTAGYRAADVYQVKAINEFSHSRRSAHKELGLKRYKGTIP